MLLSFMNFGSLSVFIAFNQGGVGIFGVLICSGILINVTEKSHWDFKSPFFVTDFYIFGKVTEKADVALASIYNYFEFKFHRLEINAVRGQKAQLELIKNPMFLTLSKKEERSTTENNRTKIWIDQMLKGFLASNRDAFRSVWL